MTTYIARRLLQMIPLVLGTTVVLFGVIQAAPGGPEAALLESDRFIGPGVIEAYRERLDVDQPVPVQYAKWLTAALRGDLGVSCNAIILESSLSFLCDGLQDALDPRPEVR